MSHNYFILNTQLLHETKDYPLAIDYLTKSLDLLEELPWHPMKPRAKKDLTDWKLEYYNKIGLEYFHNKDFVNAFENFEKCVTLYEEKQDLGGLASTFNN